MALEDSAHTHEPPPDPPPPPIVTDWQNAINAAWATSTLDFTGTRYTAGIVVKKSLTLILGDLDGQDLVDTLITVQDCADVTLQGGHIHDAKYAGIMGLSVTRLIAQKVTVERIAVPRYNQAVADGGPGTWNMNSYGIALSRIGGPSSADCQILECTVDWVPAWEGIECHGGSGHVFADNIVRHCNRAMRSTDSGGVRPSNLTFNRNLMTHPTPRPDVLHTYPYNEVALSIAGTDGATGTGNIATGWPEKLQVKDSTNVTVAVA